MYKHKFKAYEKGILKQFQCEEKLELEFVNYKIIGCILINYKNSIFTKYVDFHLEDTINTEKEFFESIKNNLNKELDEDETLFGSYLVIQAIYYNNILFSTAIFDIDEIYLDGDNHILSLDEKDRLIEDFNNH
jgi:hypothetical protein